MWHDYHFKLAASGMIRHVFATISALSLLLLAAVIVLWVRSIRLGDTLANNTSRRQVEIMSRKGALMYYDQIEPPQLAAMLPPAASAVPARWSYSSSEFSPRPDAGDETLLNRVGVSVEWREQSEVPGVFSNRPLFETITRIVVPHWLVALPFAVPPLIWMAAWRRRRIRGRRLLRSCCPGCGYDLRASTDRCPECGTPIPAKVVA